MPYKDKAKRIAYKTKWNKEYYKNNRNKECLRVKSRKLELKAWFKEYKSTLNCAKCGESHITCIEFHHKDRANKDFGLSESILKRGYSKKSPRRNGQVRCFMC